MFRLREVSVLVALLSLHACFVSSEPLLPLGAGVTIADGPVALCAPNDPCVPTRFEDDVYFMDEDKDVMGVRFWPLTESELGPVYLGEIQMGPDHDGEFQWMYTVAVPFEIADDGTQQVQVILTDCAEATEADRTAYGFVEVDQYSCEPGSLEALSEYLIATYAEDFDDPDWWNFRD